MSEDVRWQQRFSNYRNALKQLTDAVALSEQRPLSVLEEQGVIHIFKYTYELAWKVIWRFLEARGYEDIYGPRDATRRAVQFGLLAAEDIWTRMNLSSFELADSYDDEMKNDILCAITGHYHPEFLRLEQKLAELDS